MVEKLRKLRVPHTYTILISLMIIAAILSWILPAGEFVRMEVDGRSIIDPDSFTVIARNGQGIFDLLKSVPEGFARAQNIAFFLFVTGGSFHMINQSGMVESGLSTVVTKLRGYERLVIPVVLFILGIAGGTIGLAEETIVFIAIGVALARAIGYDSLVGMGIISLGAAIGFSSGFMNPFSVGVAQSIADLPLFSGMPLRLAIFIVLWLVTAGYITWYGERVKSDLSNSIVYQEELAAREDPNTPALAAAEENEMTTRQKLIAVVFIGGFIIIAYGVIRHGWFITEIGATFLGMGILSGLIDGNAPGELADAFITGAKDMMYAALIVGLAQSLVVILENGYILDTMIYYVSNSISILPSSLAAVGIYFVQIIINFFIVSGSGQAAVTMPIMVPLADSLGVTRQTAVLAFQLGDGFLDSIMPMSGTLMASLSIAKISYSKWLKFTAPLMVMWLVVGLIFVIYAQVTGYGPF